MKWAYGVTTVPSRRETYLPRTLASLAAGGFDLPRLFVDGEQDPCEYRRLGLDATMRFPPVRAFGNWILALAELYLRDPAADRYALFQDDVIVYRNLREYLESQVYPERVYWNLFSFLNNEDVIREQPVGWYEGALLRSTYNPHRLQKGPGALALVFDRTTVVQLVGHPHFAQRVTTRYGWRKIDGAVVEAMNRLGWREHVHNPSLVQHLGTISTIEHHNQPEALSFRGEAFDAMELLR